MDLINKKLVVVVYDSDQQLIQNIVVFVNKYLKDVLLGAYIHGSIGVSEITFYSDFDGLLILKNEVFKDSQIHNKTIKIIQQSLREIYKFDPLQHHGWFIIKESELKNYPQTYFPHELFEFSRSLLPDKGLEIEISLKDSYDYVTPFKNLSTAIEKKIRFNRPKNIYTLKGLLSQFMLLPALYCQARDKKGIFKKFSFDEARKDFASEEWAVMDTVSEIRQNWHYDINALQKWMLTRTNKHFRRFIIPFASPSIPNDIKSKLTVDFYSRMGLLTLVMREKLNASL